MYLSWQVVARPRKKKTKDGEEDNEEEGATPSGHKRTRSGTTAGQKRPKGKDGEPGDNPYDFSSDDDEEYAAMPTKSRRKTTAVQDQEESMDTEHSSATTRAVVNSER